MYTQLLAGIIGMCCCFTLARCHKQTAAIPLREEDSSGAYNPVTTDPTTACSIGFFLNGWQPKHFTTPPEYRIVSVPPNATVQIKVDENDFITKIPPTLFGNNANLYMTQMVDQPVLLNHIKNLAPGLLPYPGGNISSLFGTHHPIISLMISPHSCWTAVQAISLTGVIGYSGSPE